MSDIAPNSIPPERSPQYFQRILGPNRPGNQGPLRFEEGLATDTDVPDDFQQGMADGYVTGPGSPNQNNPDSQYKHADQVMQERAHVGSAAWTEAPSMLASFVEGVTDPPVTFPQVQRYGGRYERTAPEVVTD
jgi:hypothetical protein